MLVEQHMEVERRFPCQMTAAAKYGQTPHDSDPTLVPEVHAAKQLQEAVRCMHIAWRGQVVDMAPLAGFFGDLYEATEGSHQTNRAVHLLHDVVLRPDLFHLLDVLNPQFSRQHAIRLPGCMQGALNSLLLAESEGLLQAADRIDKKRRQNQANQPAMDLSFTLKTIVACLFAATARGNKVQTDEMRSEIVELHGRGAAAAASRACVSMHLELYAACRSGDKVEFSRCLARAAPARSVAVRGAGFDFIAVHPVAHAAALACCYGHTTLLTQLQVHLRCDGDVMATFLQLACECGHTETATWLLQAECPLGDEPCRVNKQCLLAAILTDRGCDMLRVLLRLGVTRGRHTVHDTELLELLMTCFDKRDMFKCGAALLRGLRGGWLAPWEAQEVMNAVVASDGDLGFDPAVDLNHSAVAKGVIVQELLLRAVPQPLTPLHIPLVSSALLWLSTCILPDAFRCDVASAICAIPGFGTIALAVSSAFLTDSVKGIVQLQSPSPAANGEYIIPNHTLVSRLEHMLHDKRLHLLCSESAVHNVLLGFTKCEHGVGWYYAAQLLCMCKPLIGEQLWQRLLARVFKLLPSKAAPAVAHRLLSPELFSNCEEEPLRGLLLWAWTTTTAKVARKGILAATSCQCAKCADDASAEHCRCNARSLGLTLPMMTKICTNCVKHLEDEDLEKLFRSTSCIVQLPLATNAWVEAARVAFEMGCVTKACTILSFLRVRINEDRMVAIMLLQLKDQVLANFEKLLAATDAVLHQASLVLQQTLRNTSAQIHTAAGVLGEKIHSTGELSLLAADFEYCIVDGVLCRLSSHDEGADGDDGAEGAAEPVPLVSHQVLEETLRKFGSSCALYPALYEPYAPNDPNLQQWVHRGQTVFERAPPRPDLARVHFNPPELPRAILLEIASELCLLNRHSQMDDESAGSPLVPLLSRLIVHVFMLAYCHNSGVSGDFLWLTSDQALATQPNLGLVKAVKNDAHVRTLFMAEWDAHGYPAFFKQAIRNAHRHLSHGAHPTCAEALKLLAVELGAVPAEHMEGPGSVSWYADDMDPRKDPITVAGNVRALKHCWLGVNADMLHRDLALGCALVAVQVAQHTELAKAVTTLASASKCRGGGDKLQALMASTITNAMCSLTAFDGHQVVRAQSMIPFASATDHCAACFVGSFHRDLSMEQAARLFTPRDTEDTVTLRMDQRACSALEQLFNLAPGHLTVPTATITPGSADFSFVLHSFDRIWTPIDTGDEDGVLVSPIALVAVFVHDLLLPACHSDATNNAVVVKNWFQGRAEALPYGMEGVLRWSVGAVVRACRWGGAASRSLPWKCSDTLVSIWPCTLQRALGQTDAFINTMQRLSDTPLGFGATRGPGQLPLCLGRRNMLLHREQARREWALQTSPALTKPGRSSRQNSTTQRPRRTRSVSRK